mgnify:CR=1 FL=1
MRRDGVGVGRDPVTPPRLLDPRTDVVGRDGHFAACEGAQRANYSLPQRQAPGTARRTLLGRIQMDAVSGDIYDQERLIEELTANADALAVRAA